MCDFSEETAILSNRGKGPLKGPPLGRSLQKCLMILCNSVKVANKGRLRIVRAREGVVTKCTGRPAWVLEQEEAIGCRPHGPSEHRLSLTVSQSCDKGARERRMLMTAGTRVWHVGTLPPSQLIFTWNTSTTKKGHLIKYTHVAVLNTCKPTYYFG